MPTNLRERVTLEWWSYESPARSAIPFLAWGRMNAGFSRSPVWPRRLARSRPHGPAQPAMGRSAGRPRGADVSAGRLCDGHADSTPEAGLGAAVGDSDSPRDSPGCERGFPQLSPANYGSDSLAD